MERNKYGSGLRFLRKALDLTLMQMSDKTGMSKSAVSDYELNRKALGLVTIGHYAKLFDVSPSVILWFLEQHSIKETE